jgi:hypothetical protein
MWEEGLFEQLIQEANACDRKLGTSVGRNMTDIEAFKVFTRLILLGKVREATRFITDRGCKGQILKPYDVVATGQTVKEVLESKHPLQAEGNPEAFIICEELPALVDVDITTEHVAKVARSLSGTAGPSGIDSQQWTDLLLKFGGPSANLREAVAALTRRLANSIVPWEDIRALKAKKLIALDKCPGVRPIGVGDALDRLCAKILIEVTGDDVEHACLADQVCSGLKSGIEGSIHAFSDFFDSHSQDGWGLLLVDAANAFNALSRPTALWNARILWPRCSRYLFNSYRGFALLIIAGSKVCLLSREGVTQGDPLAMLLYGIAVLPLVRKLKNPVKWVQNWYADDSACLAPLQMLREWFGLLMQEGPKYGYFPEPQKSYIVVHPSYVNEATSVFSDFGVKIVTGQRFLGGFVGSEFDLEIWLNDKVKKWVEDVEKLSRVAKSEPQAAFVALSKSLQNEWLFIQRVVAKSEIAFSPLKEIIQDHFLPNLCGFDLNGMETDLFCRPSRFLGVGIHDPLKVAANQFSASKTATRCLSEAIVNGDDLNINEHTACILEGAQLKRSFDQNFKLESRVLIESLPALQKRSLLRKLDTKCSAWLSIIPSKENHFDLAPDEFRDALALRYGRTPVNLPEYCDADSEPFDVNHALNCPKGGLVYGRHNECRDLNCDLLQLAGLKQVISEPIIRESDSNGENGLRADWGARGFWQPQRQALFDVCILNADSPSLSQLSIDAIFENRKNLKRRTYSEAAEARRASFTPFIATCDAVLDKEAEGYLKRLAVLLSEKWESPYSKTIGWLRARIQICILRSVSLCFRGCRTKWRGAGIEDSAPLGQISTE